MWGWQRQKKYAAAPEMPAACPSETMPMAKTRFAPFAVGENALGGSVPNLRGLKNVLPNYL